MDFIDQIKQFAKRVDSLKSNITTEEATKTSLIMPFFSILGYDVFNPHEFLPEYVADIGVKKGEKVDYAIIMDGEPTIFVEAKCIGEPLDKHSGQLLRYFGTSSKAKFGILTNGQQYKFYTDLEQPNIMDLKPFLDVDILDIKESQIAELKKFHKDNFDLANIIDTASELKYSNEFKNYFSSQLQDPKDEFVKLFLLQCYEGVKTQTVIDKFKPILKKSLNNYINEIIGAKIQNALNVEENISLVNDTQEIIESDNIEEKNKIITTEEELEAYFIVKNILKAKVPVEDIVFKDNENYSAVLYQGRPTKWCCRFYLASRKKYLIIPDENKKEVKYQLNTVYDIESYSDKLKKVLERYI